MTSNRVEALLVAVILTLHTGLLAYSASCHSPVATEVGHLPAGISHWQFLRFDLYRVNPPLVRMIAALPVLAVGPETDWTAYNANSVVRSETSVGMDFVQANGEQTFWLYTLGRWACIPFSWIGALVCYRWARDLFGGPAGLTALALWCFSPNILGHGSLLMPDVPSAALGVASCYAFWRWLRSSTWWKAVVAGLVLGLAELTKTTLLVFYPLWPLLWIVYRLGAINKPQGERDRHILPTTAPPRCPKMSQSPEPQNLGGQAHFSDRAQRLPSSYGRKMSQSPGSFLGWLREAGMLVVVIVISVYVINAGYAFEGTGQRVGEYRFKSHILTGSEDDEDRFAVGNRFADSWLASLPVPLPSNYVQGIDAQKVDFERGMRSYLRSEWSDCGWWYYYLYGLAIKVPLGTWALVAMATVTALVPRLRNRGGQAHFSDRVQPQASSYGRKMSQSPGCERLPISWRDEMLLVAPLVSLLILVSSQTGFSIHFRYVLPAFPFLFIWASRAALWLTASDRGQAGCLTYGTRLAVVAALAWSITSSLWYYPHSLSYFNELIGGPQRGHGHLLDSNISWGQDLLHLKKWYDDHPEARPLRVAMYSLVSPRLAGVEFAIPPAGPLEPGWYIVDVNLLRGSRHPMIDADGRFKSVSRDSQYPKVFENLEPVDRIGYSLNVYHVPAKK